MTISCCTVKGRDGVRRDQRRGRAKGGGGGVKEGGRGGVKEGGVE